MRKLPAIGAWFTVFIISIILGGVVFGGTLAPADFTKPSYAVRLASFDSRINIFQSVSPPRTVILGTCYAIGVETPGESFNISITGSSPIEALYIAQAYCNPSDRIIVPITIRDIYHMPFNSIISTRRETSNTFTRRLKLLHLFLRQNAGIQNEVPKISPSERAALYDREFPQIENFDLSVYHQIHNQFPKSVFVLFPTRPDASLVSVKANLLQALKDSDLPFFNLEGILPRESFRDIFHTNQNAKIVLRSHLNVLTQRLQFASASQ